MRIPPLVLSAGLLIAALPSWAAGPVRLTANAASASTSALDSLARMELSDMAPDAPPFGAKFVEGQQFVEIVALEPTKCYGIVASSIGVADVAVMLNVDGKTVAASDEGMATAVLGRGDDCYVPEEPTRAEIVLKAVKGPGIIAGRVYSRSN
jgi:hypothetical protein